MMGDLKLEQIAHHIFDLLNTGVTKLKYFSTINADQVVMLFVPVGFFVLCQVFTKLVLFNQIAIYQQFQGIVNGSSANAVILVLHMDIKRLGIKMICPLVNFFQNGKTLRGFPETIVLKMTRKNIFYFLYDVFLRLLHG